jgi:signal transduction histidine kinase
MGERDFSQTIEQDQLRSLLHDLRQYVATGMLLYDDEDALREEELRARLRTGRKLFDQMSAMVGNGAAGPTLRPAPVDIGELVEEAVTIFRHGHPALHVGVACDPGLLCELEREALHRAVTNLLENAARAAGHGGHVTVRAWADGQYVLVEISDDGRGFAQIPRGSGRGLRAVSELVSQVRGRLEIHSGADAGTRIVVGLPRSELAARGWNGTHQTTHQSSHQTEARP